MVRPAFDIDGQLPNGRFNFVKHTVATFEFDGLVIEERASTSSAARVHIELPSNNGLGGAFDCEEVLVGAVEAHTPGIHSVYRVADMDE